MTHLNMESASRLDPLRVRARGSERAIWAARRPHRTDSHRVSRGRRRWV